MPLFNGPGQRIDHQLLLTAAAHQHQLRNDLDLTISYASLQHTHGWELTITDDKAIQAWRVHARAPETPTERAARIIDAHRPMTPDTRCVCGWDEPKPHTMHVAELITDQP